MASRRFPISVVVTSAELSPVELLREVDLALADQNQSMVEPSNGGVLIRAIWHVDLDLAVEYVKRKTGTPLDVSRPEINFISQPALLEPIMRVTVTTPEDYMGDVMADLNRRRGLPRGLKEAGTGKQVVANVPLIELMDLDRFIAKLTEGRATISVKFHGYEKAPEPHPPGSDPISAAMRA